MSTVDTYRCVPQINFWEAFLHFDAFDRWGGVLVSTVDTYRCVPQINFRRTICLFRCVVLLVKDVGVNG